jgi:hypothetical protein
VYNGTQIKTYMNGVNERNAAYSGGIGNNPKDFQVGARANGQYFDGIIDEVRVENVARSNDWIKAQYLSMTDAFISFGSQEAVSCPPPEPFTPCNWQRRRKLTFNNSAQAENLVNFPVLVVLNSSRIDYGQTQNQGQDLRFTDSDGVTILAHEIEKWDEAGTSYVWVKVPQIDASSTTDHIWMYYGNASAADGQNPAGVWSNGFETVWHLQNNFTDSTCKGHDGTLPSTWSWETTGKIAGGLAFQALDVNGDGVTSGVGAGQDFTLEFWYKGNAAPPTSKGWDDHFVVHAAHWDGLAIGNFGDPPTAKIDWTSYGGCCRGPFTTDYGNTASDWYTLTLDWNGAGSGTARVRLYKNGAFQATSDLTQPTWPDKINLGNPNHNTYQAGASIDEFRVSTTVRSDAWIAAQHKSVTDTFITYNTEEVQGTTVSYFTPDAAAPGMHVPVTFVGSFCAASTVTTSSSDVIVGPSILTDATGAVVTQNGKALTTMFFVKPDARPKTGITVNVGGQALSQTLDLVIPVLDPNISSGTATLSGRTKHGTKVLGGLTVGAGGTLMISKIDPDGATAGNQGYLPATILVKGDVNIAGTVDVRGSNGTNASANCAGGEGGAGGPGGGGGGGGGMTETGCPTGGPPPVVDAVSTAIVATGESSKTVSHTTSGTNRLMIVGVSIDNREQETVASVTYNGLSLSLVGTRTNSNDARVELWRLIAPPTGTHNVVVTFTEGNEPSPAGLNRAAVIGVITFTGVDQTTPLGTMASAIGTDNNLATVNVSSAANELVLGVVSAENANSLTVGAGQTEYWNVVSPAADDEYGAGSTEPGASTVTISWTLGVSNQEWAIAGVPIKPAATTTSGTAAGAGAGFSGGGGGGSKGTGTGGAGGEGSGAVGSSASGTSGGSGGTGFGGATGGGGGMANTEVAGGDGGSGGTGNPFGTGGGGTGPYANGAPGGQGGGGGGASGSTPGGGGGGGFATAGGSLNGSDEDAGFGGAVHGNAQLVPLAGGSGGGGGGADVDITARGGGGGGGGGAVLIYATGSVTVTGTITAQGGNGGNGYTSGGGSGGGGGGSGGAIFLQSGSVTSSGTLTTAGGTGGTSTGNAAGGAGGTGRIRIDGLSSGSTVPGTAGSKFIGPVIDTLVDTTVKGRANGGSTVTLYVYDSTGAQVSGSPYTTSASGSSGTVGTWTINNVTFPSGTGYLAVKQTSGSAEVFGPGRATKGIHLINWREVY